MLATLTRPLTTTLVVRRSLGSPASLGGTRPARRAATTSSAIVGISWFASSAASLPASASAADISASASAAAKSGLRPSIAMRGSSGSTAASASATSAVASGASAVSAVGASAVTSGASAGASSTGAVSGDLDDGLGLGDRGFDDGLGLDLGLGVDRRRGADQGGRCVGQRLVEARRLGQLLGHRRERRGIFLGEEALEEGGHLVLEGGDAGADAFDAALDDAGVVLELALEVGLAGGDARLGLFADAGDLGLRPLADRGDVVVGGPAQLGDLLGGAGLDLLDGGLRLGGEALEGLVRWRPRRSPAWPSSGRRGTWWAWSTWRPWTRPRRRPAASSTTSTVSAVRLGGGGLRLGVGRLRLGVGARPGGRRRLRACRCPGRRTRLRSWQGLRPPRSRGRRRIRWTRRGRTSGVAVVGTVRAPRKPEAGSCVRLCHNVGVLAGHRDGLSIGRACLGGRPGGPGIRDVEASCQRGLVRCSSLEVPAVCAGGTGGWTGPGGLPAVLRRRARCSSRGPFGGRRARIGRWNSRARSMDAPVSPTRSAAPCATSGSRSPTAATSAARTACRRRSSAATTRSCRSDQVLTFEEIERVARDLRRARRREAPDHRRRAARPARPAGADRDAGRDLRRPDGGEIDLTLTTNGSALRALAGPLADAGLRRVTVSLDSLDDAVFGAMNGIDFPVARVLDGIDAALEAGLAPVKVNMVVRRGVNEASIVPMARWARETGVILRFIEYMDVGHSNGWRLDEVVPGGRARRADRGELAASSPRPPPIAARSPTAGDTSTAAGEFGVISSVTRPFCGDCTRARLSAEGKLYTCLFAVDGTRRPRGAPRRGLGRGARRVHRRRLVAARRPLLGAALGRDLRPLACRRSRCSRWAADGRPRSPGPQAAPLIHSLSTPSMKFVDTIRRVQPQFVDNRVDPSTTPPVP